MILDHIHPRKPKVERVPIGPQGLAAAVPAMVIALGIGLWLYANPSDVQTRLDALEAKAAAVGRAAAQGGDVKAFPSGSVCSGDLNDLAKAQINSAIGNTGLKVVALDISESGMMPGAVLRSYGFSLKGSGTYEDALAALEVLNRAHPKLFVDSFALHNHIDSIELALDGRMFCR